MAYSSIIVAIDAQIAKLKEVRNLIASGGKTGTTPDTKTTASKGTIKKSSKRVMSPEARERIAEAQRKRWAKSKRAAKKAASAAVAA